MQEDSFWILDLEDWPNFPKAQETAGILKFVEESSSILRKEKLNQMIHLKFSMNKNIFVRKMLKIQKEDR